MDKGMKPITFFVILYFLSSCAVVPKFTADADNSRCNLATKKMSLEVVGAKGGNCASGGGKGAAVVCLTTAGIFAITGIISGSIVIAGNTVHWIEKQGKCEDSFLNTYVMKHNKPLLDNDGKLVKPEDSLSPQATK